MTGGSFRSTGGPFGPPVNMLDEALVPALSNDSLQVAEALKTNNLTFQLLKYCICEFLDPTYTQKLKSQRISAT